MAEVNHIAVRVIRFLTFDTCEADRFSVTSRQTGLLIIARCLNPIAGVDNKIQYHAKEG
jgi:hypothetical protein